jgi:RNA polymerase sigma factor (sigma-70 family)
MASGELSDVVRQLRRAALVRDGGGMTDGHLLECFVTRRDEAAFEALVRRHAPMVLGVCRRVVRNSHDAEDAFQATFLVLVRKAASIGQRELLGNWLYGVAYRTALDARATAIRRRARERQVCPMPEPKADEHADVERDLRPLLDQELNRLPDKYRVAVVLCDLEGRTRRDVARQLGIPAGTLSGRLTTARRMLAKRLARHGLAPAGGGLTAALSPAAPPACVPGPLVAATVEAATAIAAGRVAAAVVSAKVAALTEGVLKAMFLTRLKIATTVLLAVGIVFGATLLAHRPMAAPPPAASASKPTELPQADQAAAEPASKPTEPPRPEQDTGGPRVLKLGTWQRGRRVAWSPDGKTLVVATIHEGLFGGGKGSAVTVWDVDKGQVKKTLAESTEPGLAFQHVVFSRDGKTIAATVSEDIGQDTVKLWDAKTLALKKTLGGDAHLACVALSPDGKLVAAGDVGKKTVMLWNAATGTLERTLKTGEAQPWSVAFSPDSKVLVVGGQKDDHSGQVQLWDAQTWTLKHVWKRDKFVHAVAFSPDGRMVASSDGGAIIQVWGVEKGEEIVALKGHRGGQRTVAFSPDSKLVAAGGPDGRVRLWEVQTGKLKETKGMHEAEIHAIAFSPDGKTLASASQDQTVRLWPIDHSGGFSK